MDANDKKLMEELDREFNKLMDSITGTKSLERTPDLNQTMKKLNELIAALDTLEVLGNLKLNDIREAIASSVDLNVVQELHKKLLTPIREGDYSRSNVIAACLSLLLFFVEKSTRIEVFKNKAEANQKAAEHRAAGKHATHIEMTGSPIVGNPNPVLKA